MSTPFMQLYVADYLGDTQHLSTEQHGAYLLLLMAMWRAGGTLPADDVKLSRIVRLTGARWQKIKADIFSLFDLVDGEITQKRLKAEYEKAQEKSAKRSDAGKRGGDAKALKDNKPILANASNLPCHSSEPDSEPEVRKTDLTSFGLALSAACAAARARGGEFIRLPTNRFETSGEEVTIFDGNIIEFEGLYPAVDVRQQIRAMKGWLLAKPERRKTRKGMMAFINSWLAREQNKAGNNGNSGLRDGQKRRTGHDSFNAAAASIAREFLGEQGGGFNDSDGDARETRPALLPP